MLSRSIISRKSVVSVWCPVEHSAVTSIYIMRRCPFNTLIDTVHLANPRSQNCGCSRYIWFLSSDSYRMKFEPIKCYAPKQFGFASNIRPSYNRPVLVKQRFKSVSSQFAFQNVALKCQNILGRQSLPIPFLTHQTCHYSSTSPASLSQHTPTLKRRSPRKFLITIPFWANQTTDPRRKFAAVDKDKQHRRHERQSVLKFLDVDWHACRSREAFPRQVPPVSKEWNICQITG